MCGGSAPFGSAPGLPVLAFALAFAFAACRDDRMNIHAPPTAATKKTTIIRKGRKSFIRIHPSKCPTGWARHNRIHRLECGDSVVELLDRVLNALVEKAVYVNLDLIRSLGPISGLG